MTRFALHITKNFRSVSAAFAVTAAAVLCGCMGPDDSEFGQQLAEDYPLGITEDQLINRLDRDNIPRTSVEQDGADHTRRVVAGFPGNEWVSRYVEFTLEPRSYSNARDTFGGLTVLCGYRVWHTQDAWLRMMTDPKYTAMLYGTPEGRSAVTRLDGTEHCWYVLRNDEDDIDSAALIHIAWPTDKPVASTAILIPAELAGEEGVGLIVIVGPSTDGGRIAINPQGTVLIESDLGTRELHPRPSTENSRRKPSALLSFEGGLTPQELASKTLTFTFRPDAQAAHE